MFGRESHLPTAFRRQPFIRGIRKRNEDIGRWAHCVIDVAEGPLHKPDPVRAYLIKLTISTLTEFPRFFNPGWTKESLLLQHILKVSHFFPHTMKNLLDFMFQSALRAYKHPHSPPNVYFDVA